MQSSFRRIRVLQSVAPQTSTCSCRKPLVQKLDTFHNEYLSAFYSRSRWQQNLRPLYYFIFFTGFYFILQGLKNVLLSTFKDSPQPLAAKKDIDGEKKSRCSDTYRSDPGGESAAYKCTCHRLAVFPSGASDWKEDNHLMSLVRESVVYRQTASVDTACPGSVPAACCVARTQRGRGNWMDSIKLPLSGVDTHRHTKAHTRTE